MSKHPEWTIALKYQQTEYLRGFICQNHFDEKDLEFRGLQRGFQVKEGAVPTIFNETISSPPRKKKNPEHNVSSSPKHQNQDETIALLMLQIQELKQEMTTTNIASDLKIQKLNVENTNLRATIQQQSAQIKQLLNSKKSDEQKFSEILDAVAEQEKFAKE